MDSTLDYGQLAAGLTPRHIQTDNHSLSQTPKKKVFKILPVNAYRYTDYSKLNIQSNFNFFKNIRYVLLYIVYVIFAL